MPRAGDHLSPESSYKWGRGFKIKVLPMKRILSIATSIEFDHTKPNLSEAMQADYEKAKALVLSTKVFDKASQGIEKMVFDNNENLQTRILAVFIAGTMIGGGSKTIIIENRPPEGRI